MEGHHHIFKDTVKRIYGIAMPLKPFAMSPEHLKHQDVYLEMESGMLLREVKPVKCITDTLYEYSVKIFNFLRDGRNNADLVEISEQLLDFGEYKHIYGDATHVDIRILIRKNIAVLLIRFIVLNSGEAPHVA